MEGEGGEGVCAHYMCVNEGMKGVHHIRAYLGDVFTHMYVGERGGRKVCTRTSVRQTVCAREGNNISLYAGE